MPCDGDSSNIFDAPFYAMEYTPFPPSRTPPQRTPLNAIRSLTPFSPSFPTTFIASRGCPVENARARAFEGYIF